VRGLGINHAVGAVIRLRIELFSELEIGNRLEGDRGTESVVIERMLMQRVDNAAQDKRESRHS
jgi:hypothetical protein